MIGSIELFQIYKLNGLVGVVDRDHIINVMDKSVFGFGIKEGFEIEGVKVVNSSVSSIVINAGFGFEVVTVRNDNVFSTLIDICSDLDIVDMLDP